MKIGIFYTGGKDSTLTILKAIEDGYEVKYLFTVKPKNFDSYMFHSVTLDITKIQAKLMNIEHVFFEVSGEKEKEVNELIENLKNFYREIDCIGVGAIKSLYQYKRFEKIANKFNLKIYAPLWNRECKNIWKELLERKFKIIITKISAEGLEEEMLGKVIDYRMLECLIKKSEKYMFDLCFEGGEAETLVLDCPLFSKEIEIKKFEIKRDLNSSWMEIKELELKNKLKRKV